ncbi:hypothetical protein RRG08_040969 [Elysia crispata]|uniref:Uncharacterized protein n=1 Tax=Elysia crispata TaxID=231223 RepID=A0AAE1E0S1_9GAST|nr:hypothetical protein RRG08_040969 [Elysia crispata]
MMTAERYLDSNSTNDSSGSNFLLETGEMWTKSPQVPVIMAECHNSLPHILHNSLPHILHNSLPHILQRHIKKTMEEKG